MTQPPPSYDGPPVPYEGPPPGYQGPPPGYQGAPPGYQAPGYQGAPPPYAWQPPPKPGTNGFAIVSLIFGVIGGVLFAVIFGIVALVQIRKQPQGGKGLAIAGLVLSGVWLALIAVVGVVAIVTSAGRDSSGQIDSGGTVAVDDLAVGDCVNGLTETGEITDLPAVPCAEPHQGEVYAIFDLGGSKWPGDQGVADEAERSCGEKFESYAADPDRADSLQLYFLHPTARSWRLGDRGVTCIALDPDGKLTGSLRDP